MLWVYPENVHIRDTAQSEHLFFGHILQTAHADPVNVKNTDAEKKEKHHQQQVHAGFGQLQRQLSEIANQNGNELSIANALWMHKGHPFLPGFLNIARTDYEGQINQADFHTGAESARAEINSWVAQKTRDRIQDILPSRSVTELTRLILVNAIYFKGRWRSRFEESQTKPLPFHVTRSNEIQVPLMHRFGEVRYMEAPEFQAVELRYSSKCSMVILLPHSLMVGACTP